MKTDAQLRADVASELQWEPSINVAHVSVAAHGGVVRLTGHVATVAEKHAIEHAVQRVEGVSAVTLALDVQLAPNHRRSDPEIAAAVAVAVVFSWNVMIPGDAIRVRVERGWIFLDGEVDWDYQRRSAEN